MRSVAIPSLCFAVSALAQGPVRQAAFEDRPALVLANDKLELTVFPHGGALASVVLLDDPEKLNPLWNPSRYARERGQ